MKKVLFFVPSGLVGLIYLLLLFAVGGWQDGENWLARHLTSGIWSLP